MTQTTLTEELTFLTRATGEDETAILGKAVKTGLEIMYKRQVADLYVTGDLSRKQASEMLGVEAVEELDYQKQALERDIDWGLRRCVKPSSHITY